MALPKCLIPGEVANQWIQFSVCILPLLNVYAQTWCRIFVSLIFISCCFLFVVYIREFRRVAPYILVAEKNKKKKLKDMHDRTLSVDPIFLV